MNIKNNENYRNIKIFLEELLQSVKINKINMIKKLSVRKLFYQKMMYGLNIKKVLAMPFVAKL